MQPKLTWKKTWWLDEGNEDSEWVAFLGPSECAELRYAPAAKHLLILGSEGWSFQEWTITTKGDLAAQLVECEDVCLSYLRTIYGKLMP